MLSMSVKINFVYNTIPQFTKYKMYLCLGFLYLFHFVFVSVCFDNFKHSKIILEAVKAITDRKIHKIINFIQNVTFINLIIIKYKYVAA